MPVKLPQHSDKPANPPGIAHAGDILAPAAGGGPAHLAPLPPTSLPPLPRSLYIHTPFCVHKCHYCDFYSFVDTQDRQAAFVDRLVDELTALAPSAGPLTTIFVGGGTPSLLRPDLWQRLLVALRDRFDLSAIDRADRDDLGAAEFTVECNPESTTPDLLAILKAGGVNRVSIGAQSFNDAHLKTLERRHDPANVARAVELARAAGIQRQSIDLIFGIPGQTVDDWDADLSRALALNTTHLSCYNLTYEPNTAMTARLARAEFVPCPEDAEEAMFTRTLERLRAAGLDRYEVSNFARPGDESRHNIAYWVQEPWLAAGPSASGHAWAGPTPRNGSWRYKNVPRLGDYLASSGFAPVVDVEAPDPLRLVRERLMMGVRLARGIPAAPILADVAALAPERIAVLERTAADAAARGWLTIDDDLWRLTDAGFLLGDLVASRLMRAV